MEFLVLDTTLMLIGSLQRTPFGRVVFTDTFLRYLLAFLLSLFDCSLFMIVHVNLITFVYLHLRTTDGCSFPFSLPQRASPRSHYIHPLPPNQPPPTRHHHITQQLNLTLQRRHLGSLILDLLRPLRQLRSLLLDLLRPLR